MQVLRHLCRVYQPHKFCATDFEKYEICNRIFVLVLPKMVLLTVETRTWYIWQKM